MALSHQFIFVIIFLIRQTPHNYCLLYATQLISLFLSQILIKLTNTNIYISKFMFFSLFLEFKINPFILLKNC